MTAALGLALTTGFLGGFGHCMGMCGPLIGTTVLDASRRTASQKAGAQILYHMGRLSTYAWLGAFFGWTGSFVNLAGNMVGLQNVVALVAGSIMILRGLEVLGLFRWQLIQALEGRISFLLHGVRVVQTVDSIWRYYLLGLFLGLLPCGLSYSAFLAAAGTGSAPGGFLFALAFGVGTLPALLALGFLLGAISLRLRGWLYRAGGASLILLGGYFLFRAWSSWQ